MGLGGAVCAALAEDRQRSSSVISEWQKSMRPPCCSESVSACLLPPPLRLCAAG